MSATVLTSGSAPAEGSGKAAAADRVLRGWRSDSFYLPVLRLAMGSSLHASPSFEGAGYALEVTGGFMRTPGFRLFIPSSGFVFGAEGGYMLDMQGKNLHAFHATLGVGFGFLAVAGLYQPRFIVGTHGGEAAIGMRNSLRASVFFDVMSFEVGHQFIASEGTLDHSAHLLLGFNPGAFILKAAKDL